jgi:DeoR/GlpR family transcriptional regulator of sugar metabolism
MSHNPSKLLRPNNTRLAAERLERIREMLRTRRIARVADLCSELDVSPATVRRDLEALEARGHVRRVHGGAMSSESRMEEPLFDDKAAIAAPQKQRIARAALKHIGPQDSIFLDGGSTVLALAPLLQAMPHLTVVTNSLRVAGTLAGEGPRLILVGGELRRLSQTFVGSLTDPLIEEIHVDTAFMGTIGASVRHGLTTTDPREAHTKSLMMSRANQVVLLADAGKLGKLSFVKFGPLDAVDIIITDRAAAAAAVRAIRKKGVKVELV